MSSEERIAHRSGSHSNEEIHRDLGLIIGQLALLTPLPEKVERMNREIGEIRSHINAIDKDYDKQYVDVKKNTESTNKQLGSAEQNAIQRSFSFSVFSILISILTAAMMVVTTFFSGGS